MFDERTGVLINSDEVSKIERNHDKAIFYSQMKLRGFNITPLDSEDIDVDIDEKTRLPKSLIPVVAGEFGPFVKFNNAIIEIHREKLVSITDAIKYLTEDYFEPKEVLKLLQTITLNYLQNDLRAKYNINQDEVVNKFLDFIY